MDFISAGIIIIPLCLWFIDKRGSLYPKRVLQIDLEKASPTRLNSYIRDRRLLVWTSFFIFVHLHSTLAIYQWEGGTHPRLYFWVNVAQLLGACLILAAWRFADLHHIPAGHMLSAIFMTFTMTVSLMSGTDLRVFLMEIISIPVVIVFVLGWTDNIASGLIATIGYVVLVMLPDSCHASEPMFCLDCLKQEVRFIHFGSCIAVLALFFQIAVDRAVLERALRRSFAANADLKDRFISTVSHELKTPLNGIIGTVALMEEEGLSSQVSSRQTVVRKKRANFFPFLIFSFFFLVCGDDSFVLSSALHVGRQRAGTRFQLGAPTLLSRDAGTSISGKCL
jgi:signal transduction histidine kinase